MVSHPYRSTSSDPQVWRENLNKMSAIALEIWDLGYLPVMGATSAMPIIECAGEDRYDEIMMPMALELLERCDAVLWVGGHSKGAEMEANRATALGKPVFRSIDELVASAKVEPS